MDRGRFVRWTAGVLAAVAWVPQAWGGCFTVAVGRAASATGAVLLAHNEDDPQPLKLDLLAVPRRSHGPGETVTLAGGGTLEQPPVTWGFLWFELQGQPYGDCLVNEHSVVIVSNRCPSRVEEADLTGGGIGPLLRRIVAERARSAREAVTIAGRLVERFGYADSGRTYTIADPREVWLLAVTRGRHWVAARVPDDAVAVLANVFTIGEVDLSDPSRFLGSADLVTDARERGWYDPAGGPFHFARAYGLPRPADGLTSLPRWWYGVASLSRRPFPLYELPFAFRPAEPVRATDLFGLLASHFEGTPFAPPRDADPHRGPLKRICSATTEYSLVAELRADRPAPVAARIWFAPRRPCVHPYVPVYGGVREIPAGFAHRPWREALADHLERPGTGAAPRAWRTFVARAAAIDARYGRLERGIRTARDRFQGRVLEAADRFERDLLARWGAGGEAARRELGAFTARWLTALEAFAAAPLPGPEGWREPRSNAGAASRPSCELPEAAQ